MTLDADNIPKDEEPPDKFEHDNIRTRYELTMRAIMRRTKLNTTADTPENDEWHFEGDDWIRTEQGWEELTDYGQNEDLPEDYHEYAEHTKVTLKRCDTSTVPSSATPEKYL